MFKTLNTLSACALVAAGIYGLWFIPAAFIGGAAADYLCGLADEED